MANPISGFPANEQCNNRFLLKVLQRESLHLIPCNLWIVHFVPICLLWSISVHVLC